MRTLRGAINLWLLWLGHVVAAECFVCPIHRRELSFAAQVQKSRVRDVTRETSDRPSRGGGSALSRHDEYDAIGSPYNVLWSPGMSRTTVLTIVSLSLIRWRCSEQVHGLLRWLSRGGAGSVVQAFVLPMLSSACCAIQLLINVLVGASGCAGFNKFLGPLRPFFLGIMVHSLYGLRWSLRTPCYLFVALLPEILYLWNEHVMSKSRSSLTFKGRQGQGVKIRGMAELSIDGMGCVACINKVDSSIRRSAVEHLRESRSWLHESGKGGMARIEFWARSEDHAREIAESAATAVREAGFNPCSVSNLVVSPADSE